jgi:ABC-2 type transport system permease protein
MKNIFRELKKHLFIYMIFMKNNVMSQMEYRANFFTGIAMELGYLVVKILYPVVIYQSGTKINGFTPDELLIFVGTFVIITGFYAGLFMMNFFFFGNLIRDGLLDILITRPVSLQFISTLKRSDIGNFLIDFTAGTIMVIIGISKAGISISALKLAGYALFIGAGAIVAYSLFLIPEILNFWFINASAIAETADSFWDFNLVPMVIYDKFIQRIGVFVLPLFVITNFPALFILGKLSPVYFLWGLLVPALFLLITRLLWNNAIKNYSSASS